MTPKATARKKPAKKKTFYVFASTWSQSDRDWFLVEYPTRAGAVVARRERAERQGRSGPVVKVEVPCE